MRRSFFIVVLLLLATNGWWYYHSTWTYDHQIRVYYNHDIEANQKIIDLIQNADKFVYFAIYTFTRTDIKDALLGAKYRGLEVRGLVDRGQTANTEAQRKIIKELRQRGIPISEQDHAGIMHLKTVVTDKGYTSGSYNWTNNATTLNDEVLEVGSDPKVRSQYEQLLKKLFRKYLNQN